MTHQNNLELAKQGDPNAIANYLNYLLQPQGITVKASLKDGCLRIKLEVFQVPNQRYIVSAIYKLIAELDIKFIKKINIYARKTNNDVPFWVESFDLISLSKSASLEEPINVCAQTV